MLIAVLGLIAVVVLTVGTAVFVAAEFALVSVDRSRVIADAEAGDRRAVGVLRAIGDLSRQLSGAQVGITLTTLSVGFLAEPSLQTLLAPVLRATHLPAVTVDIGGTVLALLIATVVQMVVGELIPKNWAISRPLQVAKLTSLPLRWFTGVLRPVISACNGAANVILRVVGIAPTDELRSGRTADELASVIRSSARAGTLPTATSALLSRTIGFGGRSVGQLMTPRVSVVTIAESASLDDLVAASRASGFSRLPVVPSGGDVDAIERAVAVKQVFAVPAPERAHRSVGEFAVPLLRVPASLAAERLLTRLQRAGAQLAAVIDEYGGLAGIVTVEDLVEELVGEVTDEHDRDEDVDAPLLAAVSGSVDISGRTTVGELSTLLGQALPTGPYQTVAGLVLARLGRLAAVGDSVEVAGWRLEVTELAGRRIRALRAERAAS